MSALDELLAAQVAAPSASAPQNLDALLSQRATGQSIPSASAPSAPPPSGLMSQLGDFASAFGHHAMNALHGTAQLVENGVAAGANLLPDNPVSRAISQTANSDNQAMVDREKAYQAGTPNSPGAYAGAATGEILPLALGGIPKGLQSIGDYAGSKLAGVLPESISKIGGRVASGAAQGATVAAASPVTTPTSNGPTLSDLVTGTPAAPSYWDQKLGQLGSGAAVGGAVPAVGSMLGAAGSSVANAVRPIVSPKSVVAPVIGKLTGGDQALIDALRNPSQLVPGSAPTTAQILATPEAVATEKALANTNSDFKTALASRSNANNDARLAAIEGVAGTPKALADALSERGNAVSGWTGPNGALVKGSAVDATPIISQLKDLQQSGLGTDPVVKRGVTDLLNSLDEGVANTGQGGTLIRPDLLDGYRQNVRKILQQYGSNGAVSSKQEAAFEPVRAAIVDAIDGANPGYRDYLATYAQKSQPINTMEAAGGILDNVGGGGRSANTSGAPQVTLSRYSSALAKALGGPYQIDSAARTSLEAVQADLQRESISSALRSPGSDTAYNLQAPGRLASMLYGSEFGGTPAASKVVGGALGGIGGYLTGGGFGAAGGATAGAAAMNKLGQLGQSRVNDVFARAMSDPQFAAELAQQQTGNSTPALLAKLLRQITPPAP